MTEEFPPQIVSSLQIDTTVSHSARVWDYWLGGKDNYPVDRQVGDRIAQMLPEIVRHARANRMFLGRAVRFLAGASRARERGKGPSGKRPNPARRTQVTARCRAL